MNEGPLSGIRVIDFSIALAGPWAAGMLADQGADVIKIEKPGGDMARTAGTMHNGVSAVFHLVNRGKRSIVLDIAQSDQRSIALDLCRTADVVIQNYRPDVAKKLGIAYEQLRELNDRIIYVSITGFGNEGPYAKRRAFDSVIQAYAGYTAVQAGDGVEPQFIAHAEVDKATAVFAAQAVCAALFARERGRGGQRIDISLLDAAVAFLWPDAAGTSTLLEADSIAAPGATTGRKCVRFADCWVFIGLSTVRGFQALCRIFGIAEDDFRELLSLQGIATQRDVAAAFTARLQEKTIGYRFEDVVAQLDAADVPFGIAHQIKDVANDPQIKFNNTFQESVHPVAGKIIEPRFPAKFSGTPARIRGTSPQLGQHAAEILAQIGR